MIRRAKSLLFSWGLGLVTLVVLLANIPQTDTLDETAWLFFAGLVAVMLNLGTMLDEDVASPASTAALMAYLTLGHDQSAALWCITAGALVGSVIWLVRTMRPGRRDYGRVLHNITMSVARMVLGVAISGCGVPPVRRTTAARSPEQRGYSAVGRAGDRLSGGLCRYPVSRSVCAAPPHAAHGHSKLAGRSRVGAAAAALRRRGRGCLSPVIRPGVFYPDRRAAHRRYRGQPDQPDPGALSAAGL